VTVNHDVPNRLFRLVVRGLDPRRCQKEKVIVRLPTAKTLRQPQGKTPSIPFWLRIPLLPIMLMGSPSRRSGETSGDKTIFAEPFVLNALPLFGLSSLRRLTLSLHYDNSAVLAALYEPSFYLYCCLDRLSLRRLSVDIPIG